LKKTLPYSDVEMLAGLKSRNEKVLREYYKLFYSGIRHFVLKNNGGDEDARDLFQDVLLVLFQKVRSDSFVLTCALGTYLYSVSRILWFKELNKRKHISSGSYMLEDYADFDRDIHETAELNERLEIYRKNFDSLSSDCQKVLRYFVEGMSIAEITRKMGYKSEQHTKNRRYRCKQSLIRQIKNTYGLVEEYVYNATYRSLS
jgi:RNA polymerase sigma factor (sigma-70 family)